MIAQKKRQEILVAAAQEFIERGYAAATLASVAARLGLTKGALAHHFPTKNELLTGLGKQLQKAISESEQITRVAYPESGIHSAVAYMVHLGAIAAKNIQVAAALQLLTDRGAPPSVISELIFTWLDGLANFLQQAQAQGQIRSDVDPVEAAEFMLTANIGTTLVPSRSKSAQNRRRRLNFIRLGMFSIGATNANTVVDEVLLSGYIDVPAINPPAPDDKV